MAKSKWDIVKNKLILAEGWARDGLTELQIAHNLGISKVTMKKYKKEHSDFLYSLKRGKEVVDFEVENALLKRALGYVIITEKKTGKTKNSILEISVVLAVAQTSGSSTETSGTLSISIVYVFIKIILFCLFSVIGVVYLPRFMNKFKNYIKPGREFLTFSIASAILIEYICGLIFSLLGHKEYLERNVKAISSGFLSLIFFASVGIEASLKGINLEVLFITLVQKKYFFLL